MAIQLVTSAGKLVRGFIQTATRFNGAATQGIHRSSSPTGNFTQCCWLRLWAKQAGGASASLFGVADTSDISSSSSCFLVSGSDITIQYNNGNITGGSPANLFTSKVGIWLFLAYTITTDTTINIYWYLDDGTNAASLSTTSTTLTAPITYAFLSIGKINNDICRADFREQRNWSAVLSSAELLTEAKSIVPARRANLDSWYPLLTTAGGAELNDQSGNGRNLTSNATTPTTIDSFPGSPAGPSFLNQDQNLIVSP